MDTFPEYDEIFSVSVDLQNSLEYVNSPEYVNVTIIDDDGKTGYIFYNYIAVILIIMYCNKLVGGSCNKREQSKLESFTMTL